MDKPGYHDGLYVGKYTVKIRDAYITYRTEKYLIDHPGSTRSKASKYARVAWRRKASGGKRK